MEGRGSRVASTQTLSGINNHSHKCHDLFLQRLKRIADLRLGKNFLDYECKIKACRHLTFFLKQRQNQESTHKEYLVKDFYEEHYCTSTQVNTLRV